MKTLYINRHAKSSWNDPTLRDFDRPLNKRGRINADFMSSLFAQEESCDLIVSSPAVRALTTAVAFSKAFVPAIELIEDRRIYEAGVRDLLAVVNELDDSYSRIMLFGHNPGFTDLVSYLDGGFSDHLVTCSRVKIDFNVSSWAEIGSESGVVEYHHYPKMYDEMKDL